MSKIARTTLAFCGLTFLRLLSFAQEPSSILDSLFREGYALVESDPARAAAVFGRIVSIDSTNVVALRQLGSLYSGLGLPLQSLAACRTAQEIVPSDTVELQIAYLLSSLGRHDEATLVFENLSDSPDPWIRQKAAPAALVSEQLACVANRPWWGQLQAYPYYDSRFENLVAAMSATAGRYLDSASLYSVYGTAGATWDTRSTGGAFPVLYADHFLLLAAGFRFRPLQNLSFDLQAGISYDLIQRPGTGRIRGDTRLVATYGNGMYPPVAYPDSLAWRIQPLADLFTSAGWYSRYDNVIGLLQGRAGAEFASYRASAASIFLRANIGWDTMGDFYNRVVELGPGVSIVPHRSWGLSFAVEALRGFYWSSTAAASPYGPAYTSVRIYILFDRPLCF